MSGVFTVTRCMVCGRRLTNPDSVKRGVGPVCWRRLERTRLLDAFIEEAVKDLETPFLEAEPLPTCPGCGKVSPNPNYCPSCGASMRIRVPLEVVA